MPTGTIQLMEGTNVVAEGTIANGTRLTSLTIPSIAAGIHTFTAKYLGDTKLHHAAQLRYVHRDRI